MPTVLAHRFRLVDPIGEGGSGLVWRAWDRQVRRVVAVKVLPGYVVPLRVPDRHPHLLTPYARVVDAGSILLATRLVRGGAADHLLAEHGALPEDFVAVLLDQLLQALVALHAAGFVHRDVKPANLLLEPTRTRRPHLWLGDLDLAAPFGCPDRDPGRVEQVGTAGYVAPEVSATTPDPRHDLYAAGVTAAELLTGHPPRRPHDLPRGRLRPLLASLTEPDPERRPPSAEAALAMLRSSDVPAGAPRRSRPRPPVVPDRCRGRWVSRGCGG